MQGGEPGSIEWALATIAASLADGTPTRFVPAIVMADGYRSRQTWKFALPRNRSPD